MWLWLPSLFGPDFIASAPAAIILMLGNATGVPGSVAGAALSGTGKPGRRSTSLIVGCLVNIVAMIVLVPPFGATGAAIATWVGGAIAANLNILFACREFGSRIGTYYILRWSDLRFLGQILVGAMRRTGSMRQLS
jgi:O-antigen/teichoic acid export membrane protein